MEPLWSPVGATGGHQLRIGSALKPQKQAKTLAVGCDQLPRRAHGKEGVSGSSPEEGLQRGCKSVFFLSPRLARLPAYGGYGALYGAFRPKRGLLSGTISPVPQVPAALQEAMALRAERERR